MHPGPFLQQDGVDTVSTAGLISVMNTHSIIPTSLADTELTISGLAPTRPSYKTPNQRYLIILDLNGVLLSSEYVGKNDKRKEELVGRGHVTDGRFVYFIRPGLHSFLELLFKSFDVGIWTCAKERKTADIMTTVFTKEERNQFVFVYDQSNTAKLASPHPYKKAGDSPIFIKHLPSLYSVYDSYHAKNTLLIDDSPYKTYLNPPFTSLFPPSLATGEVESQEDVFLMGMLWPVLEKLRDARDLQLFLKHNEPWWSRGKARFEKKEFPDIYTIIKRECGDLQRKVSAKPMMPYNVLEVSRYELPWDVIQSVREMGPVSEMTDSTVLDFAFDLGSGCDSERTDTVSDPRLFLEHIVHVRETTTHFEHVFPCIDSCTADSLVDADGSSGTCFNKACIVCKEDRTFIM